MPTVSQYYPGDFYGDVAHSLAWLYARQEKLVHGIARELQPDRELSRRDVRAGAVDELDERLDCLLLSRV